MLYKFKSKVTSDVLMLEPNGREILQIMGKYSPEKPHQGIITPQEMPAAIEALETALQTSPAVAAPELLDESNPADTPTEITVELRQRIVPFLQMLRKAQQHEQPIVWGV
jgi:hypothetical protein